MSESGKRPRCPDCRSPEGARHYCGRQGLVESEVAYVTAGPPIGRRDDWIYLIDSLIGGLETYEGVLRWLALWPDLDVALREAERLRDGMVAT